MAETNPPERADEPGALVASAKKLHFNQRFGTLDWCEECRSRWPCLTARLAEALERLNLQLFNCIGGPHTGHKYTHGITGEVTYCCPAHQDGYEWLAAARAEAESLRLALLPILERHPQEKDDLPVEAALILFGPSGQGSV